MANGTYHLVGTNKAGEKIVYSGGYTNTNVKEKGEWKVSKMVLNNL